MMAEYYRESKKVKVCIDMKMETPFVEYGRMTRNGKDNILFTMEVFFKELLEITPFFMAEWFTKTVTLTMENLSMDRETVEGSTFQEGR